MALACDDLERGLGSQPETGPGQGGESTRPVVSDKGPGPSALQKRISTKMESNETKYLLRAKKSTVCADRYMGARSKRVAELHPCGSFNYFSDIFLPSSF